VADDIIANSLSLGMKLHDGLVDHVVLRLNIRVLLVHTLRLQLGLRKRVLEHNLLLVELFLLSLKLLHT